MRLESFITKNGHTVTLKNKVTVFVGPNNSGKSQTLRDIKERMEIGLASTSIIIDGFNFAIPDTVHEVLEGLVVKESIHHNIDHVTVFGINSSLLSMEPLECHMPSLEQYISNNKKELLGKIAKFRVTNLDSSTRLNLVSTSPSFVPTVDEPSNLLQSLYKDRAKEVRMQEAFHQAFGMETVLDYSELLNLCLRIAKRLPEIPENPREALPITQSLHKIDNQGDGFKSFVGIILGLLFSKDRIILLDEPEAFLHPAQARFLGKWIVDNSDLFDGQILISTHSANFLSGILTNASGQVDIYRLNRKDDITDFNLLPALAIERLTKTPLLSSQRVVEGIFHKGVVVCEADADRAVYQSVASVNHNSNQEVLFIHAHNKQTIKDVVGLLMSAGIPVAAITDIDIVNSEPDLSNLVVSLTQKGIEAFLLDMRKEIALSIMGNSDSEILVHVKECITELLEQLNANEHTLSGAKSACERITKEFTKWKNAKSKGVEGFPDEVQDTVSFLIASVKEFGLFIVPVGELEGWMDLGTTKKNKWIVPALTVIYDGNASEELVKFVREILDFFD